MTNPLHNPTDDLQAAMRSHMIESLRWHCEGWKAKVQQDFSANSYANELESLRGDDVYRLFSFDRPEYVLIRLMGRMSISIGRRLGEIYDKLPRLAAAARFNLSMDEVVQKISGLEVDIALRKEDLSHSDQIHLDDLLSSRFNTNSSGGLAVEIRYNFNPNDSARLRKDEELAGLVVTEGYFPVYLVFSTISPRQDAISRLGRAGWHFLIGAEASEFMRDLLGVDLNDFLRSTSLKGEVHEEVSQLMAQIFESIAFREATKLYLPES